ncbi:hypothetical protein CANARDRAFT_238361 [[Candida] arabinofermentans NRRL YB-2248]|uniref:Ribosomal RNA-processing protein 1 n=1 Tax=[Candida] arabinofermentans NRRL YB-2248 TaxID=983967 RepID=A0A1E4SV45_9ASCO|nr:hypothetical protein CANARDRAFT_238361 [[Candida] arabinofermentans NRRL YB-2248]
MAVTIKTSAFVKKLASNDRKTRDHAFETLKKYLSKKDSKLTYLEYQKLWKGLYYTMWFSDRPRPQQRLAKDISSLFTCISTTSNFTLFVKSFWDIICKEWPELDQWRIDKFYMLMRFIINSCFEKLKLENWDNDLVNNYINILIDGVLSGDRKIPVGVVYHIIDVWIDELEKVMFKDIDDDDDEEDDEEETDSLNDEKKSIVADIPIDLLLKPFKNLRKNALLKTLRLKTRDDLLLDSRLQDWGIDTGEVKPKKEEEEEWTGFGDN